MHACDTVPRNTSISFFVVMTVFESNESGSGVDGCALDAAAASVIMACALVSMRLALPVM